MSTISTEEATLHKYSFLLLFFFQWRTDNVLMLKPDFYVMRVEKLAAFFYVLLIKRKRKKQPNFLVPSLGFVSVRLIVVFCHPLLFFFFLSFRVPQLSVKVGLVFSVR